ncbi:MAG: SIS domain-containing protein [Erysipelotrichaceae bacterium]
MKNKAFEVGKKVVEEIETTQEDKIEQASKLISDSFLAGHKFFVSGSGHSHMITVDFYARAGGLAFVTPILTSELTFLEHPTKSNLLERLDGYATILAELYNISENDVILIASNSGRNAYPVELALEAKKRGSKVIAITNVKASSKSTSRAKSGKLLYQIADVVIDNCGESGDAATKVDGIDVTLVPTSSIANAFIVQAITLQVAMNISEAGVQPPVFICPNVMGSTEKNDEYFAKYTRLY